jgi:hypothetical protein
MLVCEECGCRSESEANGWRSYLPRGPALVLEPVWLRNATAERAIAQSDRAPDLFAQPLGPLDPARGPAGARQQVT